VPGEAVSVSVSWTFPVIAGTAVFSGDAAATTAVGAELAEAEPALLTAVTRTRTVEPTSDDTSV
jgi:hypothetical protein